MRTSTLKVKLTYQLTAVSLAIGLLAGCGEEVEKPLTIAVEKQSITTRIFAEGELEATASTPVQVPMMRSGKIISWIAPNNIKVAQGDVVLKFDDFEYVQQQQKQQFEIERLKIEEGIAKGETEIETNTIRKGLKEVSHEREMNENVEWNNDQVFSKLEIIDSLQNIEYLNAKEGFFDWKYDQSDLKNNTSQQIRDLKKQQHQMKLKLATESLGSLTVTAPHDGIFVYRKNWSGEDPYAGQQVWPGMTVGELPDLSKMQAKMWVREQDANGLKEGLKVEVRLDAFADETMEGSIIKADKFAKPIDRENPVKYIEIIVGFENLDTTNLRPGLKLSGHILTHSVESGLVIPAQAIYYEQGKSIVYKMQGNEFTATEVAIGYRNQSIVEVTTGIQAGDQIALNKPGS